MITVKFKCVAVVACSPYNNVEDHLFAWNSTCLGDIPERFKNMDDDFLNSEIQEEGTDVAKFMEGPEIIGLCVWEGIMFVNYHADFDYTLAFEGEWRDLMPHEYKLLQDRDLEELVNLNRFSVSMG